MSSFTARESYKHKCAKEIFKQWCYSSEWNESFRTSVRTTDKNTGIAWDSAEEPHAYLNYPIVKNETINSITTTWSNMLATRDYVSNVPTYEECVANNWYPTAIIDIVLPYKGSPAYFIVLGYISEDKIELLRSLGVENLFEIDADWILSQTKVPSKLEIKKWLC
jgi:hypothetical protein